MLGSNALWGSFFTEHWLPSVAWEMPSLATKLAEAKDTVLSFIEVYF